MPLVNDWLVVIRSTTWTMPMGLVASSTSQWELIPKTSIRILKMNWQTQLKDKKRTSCVKHVLLSVELDNTNSKVDKCQYLDWERLIGYEREFGGKKQEEISWKVWIVDFVIKSRILSIENSNKSHQKIKSIRRSDIFSLEVKEKKYFMQITNRKKKISRCFEGFNFFSGGSCAHAQEVFFFFLAASDGGGRLGI